MRPTTRHILVLALFVAVLLGDLIWLTFWQPPLGYLGVLVPVLVLTLLNKMAPSIEAHIEGSPFPKSILLYAILLLSALDLTTPFLPRMVSAVLVLVAALAAAYWLRRFVQRLYDAVMAVTPERIEFVPAVPEDFPDVDRATLDAYTRELESLGFEAVFDHTVKHYAAKVVATAFGRLFVSRSRGVYATVAQVFTQKKKLPVFCSIITMFSDDWSLGITNAAPHSGTALTSHPRSIGERLAGKQPRELLDVHDRWRAEIIRDLGIEPLPVSVEAYHAFEQRRAIQRRARLLNTSFVARLAAYYRRKASPVFVNKGDWPRVAAERKRKGL